MPTAAASATELAGQILEHVCDVAAGEPLGHRHARSVGEIQQASTHDSDFGGIDVKEMPRGRLACRAALMTKPGGERSRLAYLADEGLKLILGQVMDCVVNNPRPGVEELRVACSSYVFGVSSIVVRAT